MRNYLVEILADYEQISLNQIGRFQPGLSAEEYESACKKAVERIKKHRLSTEKLLKEYLYPTLDNITNITDDYEAELYIAAQKLSSCETRHDPGLALEIFKALLERSRNKHDDEGVLKYLYWCGVTLHFFFPEAHERILAYFEEGAAYADRYHSFEDPETRQYIHRCLGNVCMELYLTGEPDKARAVEESSFSFWNELIFAGKDPDFPWLDYFLHCLDYRHGYLTKTAHTDPDLETRATLREILDNAITINKLYNKNREEFGVSKGPEYDYILWEAQFLSDLISIDLLIDNIYKRKAEFAADDFSTDAMYVKIQLNSHLMFYAAKMRKLIDRKDEIIALASKEAIEQFSSIPMTVSPVVVSTQLQLFAKNLSNIFTPVEQLEFVMQMTTFRHIPTYAHSIMVGRMATFLTKQLIEKNPGCFIGCMDIKQIDEVRNKADELCSFARTSGLCHDIGKIASVSSPSMYSRILTEEEFEIVKRHPVEGVSMMAREDGATLDNGYIDVIAGHHKYYDNSGGYPDSFDTGKSKYKIMIDIIAVANSITAATDDLGKTYAEPKSLQSVCAEIKEGAGWRYSPVVADMLEDETVKAELARMIDVDRRDSYYKAYLHAWSRRGLL